MTGILAALAGYGAAPSVTVQLSSLTVYAAVTNGTAEASYAIASGGTIQSQDGFLDYWLLGSAAASNYEVRATVTSGTLSSGTTGSWLNCGTTQTWAVSNGLRNNSIKSCAILVEIRAAANPTLTLASATINIEAESDRPEPRG